MSKDKLFYCIISFDEPRGGPVNIPAKDESEARTILNKQYGHLKGFEIIKVVDPDNMEPGRVEQFHDDMPPKKETLN